MLSAKCSSFFVAGLLINKSKMHVMCILLGNMAHDIVCRRHHHHSTFPHGLVLKKQTKNRNNRQY